MGQASQDRSAGPRPAGDRPFKITFVIAQSGETRVVSIGPADRAEGEGSEPADGPGSPGSLLRIALAAGVPIEHACGGVCACATCHVIVRQGLDACNPPDEDEEDQLDEAVGVTRLSRLACRTVPSGAADLVVEIPAWNRNLVSEKE
jgi:ferredoxin, 2Fe-2S